MILDFGWDPKESLLLGGLVKTPVVDGKRLCPWEDELKPNLVDFSV